LKNPLHILKALQLSQNPESFFRQEMRKQGDPFRLQFPEGDPIYFTGTSEGARELFSADPNLFEPARANPVEPLLGSGSLILLGGSRHKKERSLIVPPFNGERMRIYGSLIQDITLKEIKKLEQQKFTIPRFEAFDLAQTITLQIIIQVVFGIQRPERVEAFRQSILHFLHCYTPSLMFVSFLRIDSWWNMPWKKFRQAKNHFDSLLLEEIHQRRQLQPSADRPQDIFSLLINDKYDDGTSITDEDLIDELKTLLVAGHETTATALAWALFYSNYLPEVKKKIQQELHSLPTPEQCEESHYLTALCQESLRIHPVVPVILRRLKTPFTFRKQVIPAGANIGVATTLLHSQPDVWEEADQFRPERFLQKKYSPFDYAPFGGGHRRCLGAAFATYEMKIILGTLFARLDMDLTNPKKQANIPKAIIKNITMGPADPIWLTYKLKQNL
jgi:cytochrome P450